MSHARGARTLPWGENHRDWEGVWSLKTCPNLLPKKATMNKAVVTTLSWAVTLTEYILSQTPKNLHKISFTRLKTKHLAYVERTHYVGVKTPRIREDIPDIHPGLGWRARRSPDCSGVHTQSRECSCGQALAVARKSVSESPAKNCNIDKVFRKTSHLIIYIS